MIFAQKMDRVEGYFTQINLAEESIMSSNWEEAVSQYEKAFDFTVDPLFGDIINYLNSIIFSNNSRIQKSRKLTYWFNYVVNEKHMEWSELKKKLFPHFFIEHFEKKYLYEDINEPYDSTLHNTLIQLYADDQNIRPRKGRYSKEEKLAIDSMDEVNWTRFNELIEKHGFPNERNTQYSLGGQDLWPTVSLLLRHFVQNGYGEEVIAIVEKEFRELKIPRNIIAGVYDLEYDLSRATKKNYQHITSYIVFIGARIYRPLIDYSQENLDRIAHNRSKLYLPPLETSIKNAVCTTMCVDGNIKKFYIEPYISLDNLPSFLFEDDDSKKMLQKLRIDISQYEKDCLCNKF